MVKVYTDPYPAYMLPLIVHEVMIGKKDNLKASVQTYKLYLQYQLEQGTIIPATAETIGLLGYVSGADSNSQDENTIKNNLFKITGMSKMLPNILNTNNPDKVDFLKKFINILTQTYPITDKKALTYGAERLYTEHFNHPIPVRKKMKSSDTPQIAFSIPVINGEPISTDLVALLKMLRKPFYCSSSIELYRGEDMFSEHIIDHLPDAKKYGYSTVNDQFDYVWFNVGRFRDYAFKWKKYFIFEQATISTRFKYTYGKFFRKQTIAIPISVSTIPIWAGLIPYWSEGAMSLPIAAFTAAGLLIAGGYNLVSKESNFEPGIGWCILTPKGEQLLREVEAWENFVDTTSKVEAYNPELAGLSNRHA